MFGLISVTGSVARVDSRALAFSATAPLAEDRRWTHAVWLLLALGTAWRLTRYFLCFPLYGDEALLAVNFLERGPLDGHPLGHYQIAPIFFVWMEGLLLHWFGPSEMTLRLLPMLASVTSPFLFWQLARLLLPYRAACLATCFLAVSTWPVSMTNMFKPYSLDLFFALALMVAAVWVWQGPRRRLGLLILCFLGPLALLFSTPATFIVGAVGLALAPVVWREKRLLECLLYALFLCLAAGTFLAHYWLWYQQYSSLTQDGMRQYWRMAGGFPEDGAWGWLRWLLQAHTGEMLAYPAGGQRGASILTTMLVGLGIWQAWQGRQRFILTLLLIPFALGLLASIVQAYPYGVGARIQQHLAPAICLLAGWGMAWLITQGASTKSWCRVRPRWLIGGLALLSLAGMGRDVLKPYRLPEDRWFRQVGPDIARSVAPGTAIVYITDPLYLAPQFQWYCPLHHRNPSWLKDLREQDLTDVTSLLFLRTRDHDPAWSRAEILTRSQALLQERLGACLNAGRLTLETWFFVETRPKGTRLAVDLLTWKRCD